MRFFILSLLSVNFLVTDFVMANQSRVIVHKSKARKLSNSSSNITECGIQASDLKQLCRIARQRRAKEQQASLLAARKKKAQLKLSQNKSIGKNQAGNRNSRVNSGLGLTAHSHSRTNRVSRNVIVRDQSQQAQYLYRMSPAPLASQRRIKGQSYGYVPLPNIGPRQIAQDSSSVPTNTSTTEQLRTSRSSAQSSVQTVNSQSLSTGSQSSVASIKAKPAPKMIPLDDFKASVSIFTDGPAVGDPLGGYQTNKYDGFETSDRVAMTVAPSLGYRFHPNYTFSVNPQFLIQPSNPKNEGRDAQNVFMKPKESFFRIGIGNILSSGGFRWNGDLRVYPGITDDLKGTPLYLRTGQNFSYAFTDSKWSLSLDNTLRYYHKTDGRLVDSINSGRDPFDFRVTSAPGVNFQATDNLGLAASYNLDWRHPVNAPSNTDAWVHQDDGPYMEFGMSYDLNSVNISPFVDVYVRRVEIFTMAWGINLRWTLL